MDPRPPRFARRLLERALPSASAREGLLGDLHELYVERRREQGRLRADAWYMREACFAALRYGMERVGSSSHRTGRGGGGTRLSRELVFAIRWLTRSPAFAATSLTTLAVGIGAATAIFGVVRAVVLDPLPYPDPDRIVVIRHVLPGFDIQGDVPEVGAFLGQYLHYRERSALLREVGAYWTFDGPLTADGRAEYVRLGGATAGLLEVLGVSPVAGRTFGGDEPWPTEGRRGATLLTHDRWMQHYGGERDAVGSVITVQGAEYEVMGVLPASFILTAVDPVFWNAIPESVARDNPDWTVQALVGRLTPGATPEALERELVALTREMAAERYPDRRNIRNAVEGGRMTPRVLSLREWIIGDLARPLWLLLASTLLLLAVVLVNVAGLLLVRADAARRELAVRIALGSGERGLALHFLAEGVVLLGAAAPVGLVLAALGVDALAGRVPAYLPRLDAARPGWTEAAFVLAFIPVGAALFAAVPFLQTRRGLLGALREGGRGASAARAAVRVRHGFVSLQVALALVLVVGAGLILRSGRALSRVEPGYRTGNVLTFRIPYPFAEIAAAGSLGTTATPFYEEVARRVAALPGVERVGWANCLPLSDACGLGGFPIRPPEDAESGAEHPAANFQQVSPGYREALVIPLLAGRDLEPRDREERTNNVLVSAGLAQRLWRDQDPVGRSFTPSAAGRAAEPAPFHVVGVVGDVRFESLRGAPEAIVYMPVVVIDQASDVSVASFAVATTVEPLSLLDAVRGVVAELRPDIPVAFAETMESAVGRVAAPVRFSANVLLIAALLTVLLCGVGVYGVVAYGVGLRRGELGVRLALGASGRELRTLVLRQGLLMAGAGVAVGVLAAGFLGGVLRSLLFGVSATDPATFTVAAALLLVAAGAAAYLPARRASRVHPAEVLRGG